MSNRARAYIALSCRYGRQLILSPVYIALSCWCGPQWLLSPVYIAFSPVGVDPQWLLSPVFPVPLQSHFPIPFFPYFKNASVCFVLSPLPCFLISPPCWQKSLLVFSKTDMMFTPSPLSVLCHWLCISSPKPYCCPHASAGKRNHFELKKNKKENST